MKRCGIAGRGRAVVAGAVLLLAVRMTAPGQPAASQPEATTQPAPTTGPADDAVLSVPPGRDTLGYQLHRVAPAGQAKAGLVVWLHPAGATMNDLVVGEYRGPLARAGLALLIPVTTDVNQWTGEDAGKLPATIDDAVNRDGRLNPAGVILLGYSAGGQVAFALAARNPGRFAGVVAMSAVPQVGTGQGRVQVWVPPAEQKDRLRFFLVVGDQESTRPWLRMVEAVYRARGFSVTLKEVPDAGHRYPAGLEELLTPWMAAVAGGQAPADPLAGEREKDLAARKAVADKIIQKLNDPRQPARRPGTQPDQDHDVGPFRLTVPSAWASTAGPAGGRTALWRLHGDGDLPADGAGLAVEEFNIPGPFERYLQARYATRTLQGLRTAVHEVSRPQVAGLPAHRVVLSEQRIGRQPGATRIEERTIYSVELFLPTGQPNRAIGLAIQWRSDLISPDQAAGLVDEILRNIRQVAPLATQPATSPDEPDLRDILPPKLLD